MRWTVPQIDYIDKVPYRVADTRGTVNGKDTGVEGRGGPGGRARVCVHVCARARAREVPPRARIGRKWSWERYRCVKAKTGFRGARPARWRVGVYKVFDTS